MKKLLGIVFLGLLWCNFSFAQTVILRCEGVSFKKIKAGVATTKKINYYSIFKIDLENNFFTRDGDSIKNFFINTEDELLWYNISPSFGGDFMLWSSRLSRITGDWRIKSLDLKAAEYKILKKEFDKINKTIKNYKPNLEWGDETYEVSENSPKDKELQKFNIIEKKYSSLKNTSNHSVGYWQCKKQDKAF